MAYSPYKAHIIAADDLATRKELWHQQNMSIDVNPEYFEWSTRNVNQFVTSWRILSYKLR